MTGLQDTIEDARQWIADEAGGGMAARFAAAVVELADRGCVVVGVSCAKHHGAIHGHEAEELRAGIEKILADVDTFHMTADDGYDMHKAVRQLLDEIDARDSLAFRERAR